MKQAGLGRHEIIKILKGMHEDQQDLDYDYICCVLFPESYPAVRVPTSFSLPSSIFSSKITMYVNTGTNGSGFVSVLPLDTTYNCVYGSDPITAFNGVPASD